MKYVAQRTPGAKLEEFETAHMIKLESPSGFMDWLREYLDQFLLWAYAYAYSFRM